ncbi:MAG: Arm DNA-binding domain-containing protein, partial [Deltaproteobacteria bacterium]|nr:Arm DNA-binding domain-containing protein [Deltaproteobacteria bacterium]
MSEKNDRKLTKRTIDALAATGKDAVYWDRDLQGFGVRVYASGRKVFVVQTRGPQGPRRVTLGRCGRVLADAARKQAAEAIDRIKRGL